MLVSRGLERVLGDLTALGYDTKWTVMGAADVGANHQRDRIWIIAKRGGLFPHTQHDRIRRWEQQQKSAKKTSRELANSRCELRETRNATKLDSDSQVWSTSAIHNQSSSSGQNVSNTNLSQQQGGGLSSGVQQEHTYACDSRWWQTEPNVGRVADGVASGVDRLKAIGNGQVPLCAAEAWRLLTA